ncbi:MAG: chromate transporter [Clostridiales bacterium]|nr:chromate transporter [Clostridiales bacterium]MDO5140868.1 chromate transporter [Eubacteriales bacterium]
MSTMLQLFLEFMKIGLIAVGGGPATLPYLMELTEKYDWYTMTDLTNMIAVSESTPGPLGLNMATYAGFKTLGTFGGVVSTTGLVIPSIIIICLIARFLEDFNENKYVRGAFSGIRPAVCAIIAVSVFGVCRVSMFTELNGVYTPIVKTLILCVIVFGLLQVKKLQKLHPAFWLLAAAIAGIVFRF